MTTPSYLLVGIPLELPDGVPPYTPSPGSIQAKADCCGRLVWQGPEQQRKKATEPEIKIVCALCVLREALKEGVMPTLKVLREEP